MYKMINKRLDPNHAISEHTILADVRRLAFMKCKNLEETKLRVMQLFALSNELCDKVGREMEPQEKTVTVWMFMDDDTKARSEKKELVECSSSFSAVCGFLEILTHKGENRRAMAEYAKLQAPVRMDLSALQAKEAVAAAAFTTAPEAPEPTPPGDALLDAFGNPQKVV